MDSTIFVFYDLNKKQNWGYPKFPKGWTWTGAGITKKKDFPQEEQFNGPKKNRTIMRNRLNKKFESLKKRGIVKRFKIRNSYLP